MKLKVFVPKDRIGNEESRHRSCPRPISYPDGRGWEADGGVNQEAALPYFLLLPGHPQAHAGGGRTSRPCGSHSYHLLTFHECSLCAKHITSIVSFILTMLLFTPLGRKGN